MSELSGISQRVDRLRQCFNSGKTRDAAWRISQLNAVKAMTQENEAAILAALNKDLGKCQLESWSAEIGYIIGEVEHTLKYLKKWMKPRPVSTPMVAMPGKSYIQPEPFGVALIIGAWNYPFQLTIAPFVAALAAGNCAVLKPSELAEHTSSLIAELVPKYLDNDAVTVIEGGVAETTELLKQRFDNILYTGGEVVGKIVMRAAAEHLTPVTLELGGKSPCIVDSHTDLDVTANRIAWCKWMNAGQTCVAPDYIIVEKAYSEQLVVALKEKIHGFYGNDAKASPDYARIINDRHWQRIVSYLENQTLVHGGASERETKYIEPTIVMDPVWDSPLMQNEIFGPILPIVTVDKIEQASEIVNQHPKPLAMYVFTKRDQFADHLLAQTSAGNVCVNDGMMFMANQDLPFGGVGNSGMGSYCGQAGFDTFSHLKAVMKRSFMLDVDIRYPPYTDKKLKLLKMLR
ncbi:MAG: aldehyde dehydrogenase family protein [Aestuariibacter sp.]